MIVIEEVMVHCIFLGIIIGSVLTGTVFLIYIFWKNDTFGFRGIKKQNKIDEKASRERSEKIVKKMQQFVF